MYIGLFCVSVGLFCAGVTPFPIECEYIERVCSSAAYTQSVCMECVYVYRALLCECRALLCGCDAVPYRV